MKKLLFVLLVFISVNLSAQGPWTKKKKEAYLQISYTAISNYSEVFGDPSYFTEREINDNTLQFYTEYGLTDKTTLVLSLPFKSVSSNDLVGVNLNPVTTEDSKTSLGNIQLGLKHNFLKKNWLLTGQLTVEFNTGSFDENSGLSTGYDATTISPLLITGKGFDNWYIQFFSGADIRTNNYSSSLRLGGEVGYKAVSWLWIGAFVDGVASLYNGDLIESRSSQLTSLYVNNQSYSGYGFKFTGELNKKAGLNLAIGGAFGGRNVAKSPAITLGAYYKLHK